MADVEAALRAVASIGSMGMGALQCLTTKDDLLLLLLENEQMRLVVWLYPLDHERRHIFSSNHAGHSPPEVSKANRSMKLWLTKPVVPFSGTGYRLGRAPWPCDPACVPLSICETGQRCAADAPKRSRQSYCGTGGATVSAWAIITGRLVLPTQSILCPRKASDSADGSSIYYTGRP